MSNEIEPWCTFQSLGEGGLSGSEDRGGVTTVSNSLILGGWVTKVLKNGSKKYEGASVGDNAPAEKLE